MEDFSDLIDRIREEMWIPIGKVPSLPVDFNLPTSSSASSKNVTLEDLSRGREEEIR